MIRNSFIFLEKIGPVSEKNIWSQGITNWELFLKSKCIKGISQKRKGFYDRKLIEARKHLNNSDASYFSNLLPKSEVWRLFKTFQHDVLYLDIETSGYYGDITMIGLYDGQSVKTLIKGYNLDKCALISAFEGKKILVTFNGISFDIPSINRCFGDILDNFLHFDLRFSLAKLGYSGGLKAIEKEFGLERKKEIVGVDSVQLWQKFLQTNNKKFLKKLMQYNEKDVVNLEPLAFFVANEMGKKMMKI